MLPDQSNPVAPAPAYWGFESWYEAVTGKKWNRAIEAGLYAPASELTLESPFFMPGLIYELKSIFLLKEGQKALKGEMQKDLNGDFITSQKRRWLMQKLAAPEWRDREKIKEIYTHRNKLNDLYPDAAPFHVDHIIPIISKEVCGLHVEHNLRIIPGKENKRKSNRLDEEITKEACWSLKIT